MSTAIDLSRQAELDAYELLDSEPLPTLQRLVDLTAALCGGVVAQINAITTTQQVPLASSAPDPITVPRAASMCDRVIGLDLPTIVVPDPEHDERFADSPFVTGEYGAIRFYAATQLRSPRSETAFGTLCVYAEREHELTPVQLDLLTTMGQAVVESMEQHRRSLELGRTLARIYEHGRELVRSNESLAGFAGQVSHDLQGPLASVRLALEILTTAEEEERGFLLERALSGTQRMSRTIVDLMDFATIGGGKPPQRVEVGHAIEALREDLDHQLEEVELSVETVPAVVAHEAEVRAVLQNLISNAVKFTPPHTAPRIWITGERVVGEQGAAVVVVRVRDNGPGISEPERERIFEMLTRGRDDVEGHGIGLATCARIVRSHGGRIGVREPREGGAEFWFELPAAD